MGSFRLLLFSCSIFVLEISHLLSNWNYILISEADDATNKKNEVRALQKSVSDYRGLGVSYKQRAF